MKKVIFSLALVAAISSVKADYLYWQVEGADIGNVSYSALYANGTQIGYYYQMGSAAGASGSVNIGTSTSHSNPAFDYASADYYIEYATYNSETLKNEVYSGSISYKDLYIKSSAQETLAALAAISQTAWSGVSYTKGSVPEPTSGLMMLVGMALLGLKRRRA